MARFIKVQKAAIVCLERLQEQESCDKQTANLLR